MTKRIRGSAVSEDEVTRTKGLAVESAEVRWFLGPNDLPPSWKEMVRSASEERVREDLYLVTGSPLVGLRCRANLGSGSQLELKTRLMALGAQAIAPSLVGCVERWSRSSYGFSCAPGGGARTFSVKKRRCLLKYELLGSVIQPVPPTTWVSTGCRVDLTEIHAAEGQKSLGEAVSLGFEAFSDAKMELLALWVAANTLVARTQTTFEAPSMSYPEWLLRISKPERP